MKSLTVSSFWKAYKKLPFSIQKIAKEKFCFWEDSPYHPSLKFKCVNVKANIWSIRITIDYRALAVKDGNEFTWFWVGSHEDYNNLI